MPNIIIFHVGCLLKCKCCILLRVSLNLCILSLGGGNSAQLKVFRVVATSVGLDMMMGVVSKTAEALESMTSLERLYEAARCVLV